MATVFISQVLNQFIIIVNAPLRVERSLKYIQITFKVFVMFWIWTLLYTHTDILIANHLRLIPWINYRFQARICSSTFALKLMTIDLAFPLPDQEIQEKLYLWKCQLKFIAKYLIMQVRQLQLATAATKVRNRISVILFPKDRQK